MLASLKGGIIVSVQANQGEPLDEPEILTALAESALSGGAVGVRMAFEENIRCFKKHNPKVPLIGLTKPSVIPENAHELVYITPTFADVEELAVDCEIVAMDATQRPRPNGETLENIVAATREHYPNLLLMADVATLEEGKKAADLGFDCISTTLSGYTVETQEKRNQGPDFDLLKALVGTVSVPVFLEGRVWEPTQVTQAFELGAHAVVIGSAITRPHEITRRFAQAIPQLAV